MKDGKSRRVCVCLRVSASDIRSDYRKVVVRSGKAWVSATNCRLHGKQLRNIEKTVLLFSQTTKDFVSQVEHEEQQVEHTLQWLSDRTVEKVENSMMKGFTLAI